jgi:hypothetical protein
MLTLFNKYKSESQVSKAILVARNLFNKYAADESVFAAYFGYLCELAESLPAPSERKDLADQARVALAFYCENAELTEAVVAEISAAERRLAAIYSDLSKIEKERAEKAYSEIEAVNSDGLKQLYALKEILRSTSTQEAFDKALADVGAVDARIDKDAFTTDQSAIYDSLTREHTALISDKMREFEHEKNVKYNKRAANAFALAFKRFQDDETKYKNQSQLFSLVSTTLFAYAASRLFNETLIYYNHVYSYIFSKLDNDGKLKLTQYSVECERKRR